MSRMSKDLRKGDRQIMWHSHYVALPFLCLAPAIKQRFRHGSLVAFILVDAEELAEEPAGEPHPQPKSHRRQEDFMPT